MSKPLSIVAAARGTVRHSTNHCTGIIVINSAVRVVTSAVLYLRSCTVVVQYSTGAAGAGNYVMEGIAPKMHGPARERPKLQYEYCTSTALYSTGLCMHWR